MDRIQGVGEESRRRKDLGGWRNIGEDEEKSSRVMVEAHPKVKEDAVGVKMKIGGGGPGEEEEEDWKRR